MSKNKSGFAIAKILNREVNSSDDTNSATTKIDENWKIKWAVLKWFVKSMLKPLLQNPPQAEGLDPPLGCDDIWEWRQKGLMTIGNEDKKEMRP